MYKFPQPPTRKRCRSIGKPTKPTAARGNADRKPEEWLPKCWQQWVWYENGGLGHCCIRMRLQGYLLKGNVKKKSCVRIYSEFDVILS